MTPHTAFIAPSCVGNQQGGTDSIAQADEIVGQAGFAIELFDLGL
jgi:hypothetical protein